MSLVMAEQSSDAGVQRIQGSATLIMGATGSGKSSLVGTFIEWVWETYRAPTFLYLCDGGGFPTQVQALINRGIARFWRMRSRSGYELAPETIQRAAEGWWPARIIPKTGECAPTVRLVPPMTDQYEMTCPNGHVMRRSAVAAAMTPGPCPTCKVMVTALTMLVKKTTQRTVGFPEMRAVVYEGVSSFSSWMMEDLSHRDLGGEKSRLGGTVLSGDMMFGENNRAQIGFTQNSAERWILSSMGIPDLVVPPVWTALTHEASDEGGLAIRGPLIAGQAKTAVAPQWVGNCLEAIVVEPVPGKKFRRLNLQEYIDHANVRHLCKVRAYPGTMPAWLEDEDDGTGAGAFANFNLGLFHRLLDESRRTTEKMYTERYADAPGMPSDEGVTFGEAVAPPVPTPTPGPVAAMPRAAAPTPTPTPGPTPGPRPSGAAPAPVTTAPRAVPPGGPVKTAPSAPPVAAPTPAPPRATPGPSAAPAPAPTPAPSPARPSAAATGPVPVAPPAPKGPMRIAAPPPPGRRPG